MRLDLHFSWIRLPLEVPPLRPEIRRSRILHPRLDLELRGALRRQIAQRMRRGSTQEESR
jgi:hypothetical protein